MTDISTDFPKLAPKMIFLFRDESAPLSLEILSLHNLSL